MSWMAETEFRADFLNWGMGDRKIEAPMLPNHRRCILPLVLIGTTNQQSITAPSLHLLRLICRGDEATPHFVRSGSPFLRSYHTVTSSAAMSFHLHSNVVFLMGLKWVGAIRSGHFGLYNDTFILGRVIS